MFEEIIMDRLKYHLSHAFSKHEIKPDDFGVDWSLQDFVDRVVLTARGEFLGKKWESELILNRPLGWKQMFKEVHRDKWWMRWWVKRHPIEREKIKIDVLKYVIFPEYKVPKMLEKQPIVTYIDIRSSDKWIRPSDDQISWR